MKKIKSLKKRQFLYSSMLIIIFMCLAGFSQWVLSESHLRAEKVATTHEEQANINALSAEDTPMILEELEPEEESEYVTEEITLTAEEKEEQGRILEEIIDPEVRTTTNVSTWEQFRTAINTQSVTVINVTASISGNTSLDNIDRNLTINGNGYTINSQSQRYIMRGNNRQLRINNATLVYEDISANVAGLISINSSIESANLDVFLNSVNYIGDGRLVSPINMNTNPLGIRSVVFNGGTSNVSSAASTILVGVRSVQLINGATVNHSGSSRFVNNLTSSTSTMLTSEELIVEEGSTLLSSVQGISAARAIFRINGRLESGPINGSGGVHTVIFGSRSQSVIENRGQQSVFWPTSSSNSRSITINSGATFDFINTAGGPLIHSSNTGITTIHGDTPRTAFWNLGAQNNDFANLAFSNIQYNLSGTTAQTVNSTNNTEFRNLYSSQGLAGYSRMRSSGETIGGGGGGGGDGGAGTELRTITLYPTPDEGGNPVATVPSLAPGSTTLISASPNPGFEFVRWIILLGDGRIANSTAAVTTFTMGNSDTFAAAEYRRTTRSLTLQASPVEGGNPTSGSSSLVQGGTTSLTANPNDGYEFSRWEIVSGTGANINNLTSPTATFTMGSQDTVVRAIYEKNQPREVHVHHVDTAGQELADTEILTGMLGEAYETNPKEIEGYVLAETPSNASGVFTEDLISVTYVYEVEEAILTIEFVNEIDQILSDYTVTLERMTGDTIDLTAEPEVIAQLNAVLNDGYEIVERPENETEVVLDRADVTVRYKLQGVLRLSSAPNILDFGSLTYDARTKRVEDPAIDQPLIVTDTRADSVDGWTLTASLSTPMTNDDGQELMNALRYVYQGQETILDSNAQMIYLNTSGFSGRFNVSNSWGDQTGTDGMKLQIGSSDVVHTGSYVGVITWKVMAGQP